jgi:hypothetical protein
LVLAKMNDRRWAIPLFSLKVGQHFVGSFIAQISFQYLFEERNGALMPGLIQDLCFASQSGEVTRRRAQCLVEDSKRICPASLEGKRNSLQPPEPEVFRRFT